MAQLQDNIWTTRADVETVRPFSKNIEDSVVEIYIREAQQIEIKGFLGKELYYAMQQDWDIINFTSDIYNDLWFGSPYIGGDSYTVNFTGLIEAAKYFSFARFLDQQQNNVDRFGVSNLNNEIAENTTPGQIRGKTGKAYQTGINYQNAALDFLDHNKTDYPEWEESRTTNPKRSAFGFFKV